MYLGYDSDAPDLLDPWIVGRGHAVEVARDLRPQIRHRDELGGIPPEDSVGEQDERQIK